MMFGFLEYLDRRKSSPVYNHQHTWESSEYIEDPTDPESSIVNESSIRR
jgi:hypothetical protein